MVNDGGEGEPESIETVKDAHTNAPLHPPSLRLYEKNESHKNWVVENNKIPARIGLGLAN
jgi:hypothetical protein